MPAPGSLRMSSVPPVGGDPVRKAPQTGAVGLRGAADAVIRDRHDQLPFTFAALSTTFDALACLTAFVSPSQAMK